MERDGGGSIVVSDYDPAWPAMFEHECTRLHAALDPFVLTIEHIGSTAVPGLAAKPIIDLQASVRRLAEAQSRCVEPLQALGYTYLPQYRPGCRASSSSGRDWPGHGLTTSIFCNETIPDGRTVFCFVTICATIRKQQPPTPS